MRTYTPICRGLTALFLLLSSVVAWGQMPSCQDQVRIDLSAECTAAFLPQQAAAALLTNPENYRVRVGYPDNSVTENSVDRPGSFSYILVGPDDFACTGTVEANDTTAPIIQSWIAPLEGRPYYCTDVSNIENNPATLDPSHPNFTGVPQFVDACGRGEVDLTFRDSLVLDRCYDPSAGRIFRRFTATDAAGNRRDTIQIIPLQSLPVEALQLPDNRWIHTCRPDTLNISQLMAPFWIDEQGDTISLANVHCGGQWTRSLTSESICQGQTRYTATYQWTDPCRTVPLELGTRSFVVGDLEAPVSAHQEDTTQVATGPFDCTASMSISEAALRDRFEWRWTDCGTGNIELRPFTLDEEGNWQEPTFSQTQDMLTAMPVGLHALQMILTDGCGQMTRDTFYVRVVDAVSPRVICAEITQLNLDAQGMATLSVDDFDAGTEDNCGLATLRIRRTVPTACLGFFIEQGYDLNGDNRINEADGFSRENGIWYTPWAENVPFFCCDDGQRIWVELQARDQNDNVAFCRKAINVVDEQVPDCRAPLSVRTRCNDPRLSDLSAFGMASSSNNSCGQVEIRTLPVVEDLDQCGAGTLIRSFQAIKVTESGLDLRSDTCHQTIQILPDYHYAICFPPDVRATCGDDPAIPGLTITESDCDLMAISHQDTLVRDAFGRSNCPRIQRTWQVINWCEYNGDAAPVVVQRDWDAWNGTNPENPRGNGQEGDQGICVIVQRDLTDVFPDTVWYDIDTDPFNNEPDNPSLFAEDGYYWRVISGNANPESPAYYNGNGTQWGHLPQEGRPGLGSNGYWIYQQIITLTDTVAPTITPDPVMADTFPAVSGSDCSAEVALFFDLSDNCDLSWDAYTFAATLDLGDDGTIDESFVPDIALFPQILVSGRYPLGTHLLQLRVTDPCGNTAIRNHRFTVADRRAPRPVCINGLTVELSPTAPGDSLGPGAVPVFVDQLMASELTDCSGDVRLSLNLSGQAFDPDRQGLVLTCADLGTVLIDVHAWDAAGNLGSCETYVLVRDQNPPRCQPSGLGQIRGLITTPEIEPVEDAVVRLSGPFDRSTPTDELGAYTFSNLPSGFDYQLRAELDRDYLNGVSTYDIYLIQEHILGEAPFTTIDQYLAADANRSGTVTVSDMVQIRKLILNVDLALPGNTSWRFYDAGFVPDNPAEALMAGVPETIRLEDLSADSLVVDFTGVKVGDVSGNALSTSLEPRSGEAVWSFAVDNPWLVPGQRYAIPVRLPPVERLQSLQFALSLAADRGTLHAVRSNWLSPQDYAFFSDRQVVTAAWNAFGSGVSTADTTCLLTLEVSVQQPAHLAEILQLAPRYTPGEVVQRHRVYRPNLQFRSHTQAQPQVRIFPNPFQRLAQVDLYLPQAEPVDLIIRDWTGRILYRQQLDLSAGAHRQPLPANAFPQPGAYVLEIRTQSSSRSFPVIKQ